MNERRSNFLSEIVEADLAAGKNGGKVVTRFPPEPNGFLHIGHAKSIILNFGLAQQFSGRTHLRFDDTNPTTEEQIYVENIAKDVHWLGFDWGKHLYYASDFFEQMYSCAIRLIKDGKAYVDSQNVDQIREGRGNFDKPGVNSPFRNRSVEENLKLFEKMRAGEMKDGEAVLRAKIDMSHPNVLMRDPLLYRIRHSHHHRTGDKWCIYPMYDYAHPLEDAHEGVTHSICTLEFETNRELYDWVLDNLGPWDPRPRQYEFARLALGYTVMSKRKLLQLVQEKRVSGWDDPRMPTIAGMRRRGVTPEALREFAELIGVAKNNSLVDIGKFEFAIRSDLEKRAPRAMAVLNPLKVTITNWPAGKVEELELPWWPGEPARGSRRVPFGGEVLIEREDFAEVPPKDWRRLAPGWETRLNGAFVIKCDDVVKNAAGEVVELRCSYDPNSKGGDPADKRKIPGTLHWVHASKSVAAEVRLYDRLFSVEQPDAEGDFLKVLNPESLQLAKNARVEPALISEAKAGQHYQFLRLGYFFVDPVDSKPGAPVFNRTITLKDTWAKAPEKQERTEKKPKTESKPAAPKRSRAELRAEIFQTVPASASHFDNFLRHGVSEDDADVLIADNDLATYVHEALHVNPNGKLVAKWAVNELRGLVKDFGSVKLSGPEFGKFVGLVDAGRV
ncbi:MAG: glutamine--tRNA ligase/YqeY domain fusion protein, partial [Myxococcaceae bacterium]